MRFVIILILLASCTPYQIQADSALRDLKSNQASVRADAILKLVKLNANEHSGEIAELLKDEDMSTRSSAVRALAEFQAEFAKDIAALLDTEYLYLRHDVIESLGVLQAKEYTKEIAFLLTDVDSSTLAYAVWALGNLQEKEYQNDIKKLSSDTTWCYFYNPNTKKYENSTVGKIAADVLKSWGMEPKVKDQK